MRPGIWNSLCVFLKGTLLMCLFDGIVRLAGWCLHIVWADDDALTFCFLPQLEGVNGMMSIPESGYYESAWTQWDDMKAYGPMSRHVRRIIFKLIRGLQFETVLDAGCGVGTLLSEIGERYPSVELFGSEYAETGLNIAEERVPRAKFFQSDLAREHLPHKFDLVLCIDVLEHIEEDFAALKNLRAMTEGYFLLVVPLGPLFEMDVIRAGHVHGYSRAEVDGLLQRAGFNILRSIEWGFPLYNIYRRLLHRLPERTTTGEYGASRKLLSTLLYWIFYLNLPVWGERYFVLCS
jgi:SAM-dependent methyltransferase